VYEAIERWFATLAPDVPFAVADVPLLFETGHDRDFDAVVVAACEPEEQMRRVMARDGLSEADARARLAAQWPIAEKIRRADYVVWTTGTVEETSARVADVAKRIASRSL
jgi:dephospho-CoA kinase